MDIFQNSFGPRRQMAQALMGDGQTPAPPAGSYQPENVPPQGGHDRSLMPGWATSLLGVGGGGGADYTVTETPANPTPQAGPQPNASALEHANPNAAFNRGGDWGQMAGRAITDLPPELQSRLTQGWETIGAGQPMPATFGDYRTARQGYYEANPRPQRNRRGGLMGGWGNG